MTDHTPGPWTARVPPEFVPNVRYWIDDQRGIPIADIKIHGNELADANLIAAAPDFSWARV